MVKTAKIYIVAFLGLIFLLLLCFAIPYIAVAQASDGDQVIYSEITECAEDHSWTATWTWAPSETTVTSEQLANVTARADLSCSFCGATMPNVEAEVEFVDSSRPGCENAGYASYTATVSGYGEDISDTNVYTISAMGHSWSAREVADDWIWNFSPHTSITFAQASALKVDNVEIRCDNTCGGSRIITNDIIVVKVSDISYDPTCKTEGYWVVYAYVIYDGQRVEMPSNFMYTISPIDCAPDSNYLCTMCGELNENGLSKLNQRIAEVMPAQEKLHSMEESGDVSSEQYLKLADALDNYYTAKNQFDEVFNDNNGGDYNEISVKLQALYDAIDNIINITESDNPQPGINISLFVGIVALIVLPLLIALILILILKRKKRKENN